jgi:hypothetical protein
MQKPLNERLLHCNMLLKLEELIGNIDKNIL